MMEEISNDNKGKTLKYPIHLLVEKYLKDGSINASLQIMANNIIKALLVKYRLSFETIDKLLTTLKTDYNYRTTHVGMDLNFHPNLSGALILVLGDDSSLNGILMISDDFFALEDFNGVDSVAFIIYTLANYLNMPTGTIVVTTTLMPFGFGYGYGLSSTVDYPKTVTIH